MELIEGTTKYKFIPHSVTSFLDVKKINILMENDAFIKYEAIAEIKGELIVCNDITKTKKYTKRLFKETYEEYVEFISNHNFEKDRWIYNIIDGLSEQKNIIYRDECIIVIPSYTWDSKNVDKLHILCLPTDKSLRTIRDLTMKNVPLLEHMRATSLRKIEEIYGLKEEMLKMFFHYEPSTYHLHIHFINTANTESWSSVEYSHDLDSVIFNLKIDTDYYRKIKLNRRI